MSPLKVDRRTSGQRNQVVSQVDEVDRVNGQARPPVTKKNYQIIKINGGTVVDRPLRRQRRDNGKKPTADVRKSPEALFGVQYTLRILLGFNCSEGNCSIGHWEGPERNPKHTADTTGNRRTTRR
jgi:hypothetical protein